MAGGKCGLIDMGAVQRELGVVFTERPVVVGGAAMEYYGMRERGSDTDFIIANPDYLALAAKYPENRKDMWADLGVTIFGYEMFRSIWKFDHGYFSAGAVDCGDFLVVSIEKLFMMKVLAWDSGDKHKRDLGLLLEYLKRDQNPGYRRNMEENIARYLAVPNGTILG